MGVPVTGRRAALPRSWLRWQPESARWRRRTGCGGARCLPSWPVTPRHVAISTAPLKTSSVSIGSVADCSPPTTKSGPRWRSLRSTASTCAAIPNGVAPLALWAVGGAHADEVAFRARGIVGTRAATAYGEHVAADLSEGLCERGVAVVSGGAYGIDGAAHRAALAADGCTVAVLAGGRRRAVSGRSFGAFASHPQPRGCW